MFAGDADPGFDGGLHIALYVAQSRTREPRRTYLQRAPSKRKRSPIIRDSISAKEACSSSFRETALSFNHHRFLVSPLTISSN